MVHQCSLMVYRTLVETLSGHIKHRDDVLFCETPRGVSRQYFSMCCKPIWLHWLNCNAARQNVSILSFLIPVQRLTVIGQQLSLRPIYSIIRSSGLQTYRSHLLLPLTQKQRGEILDCSDDKNAYSGIRNGNHIMLMAYDVRRRDRRMLEPVSITYLQQPEKLNFATGYWLTSYSSSHYRVPSSN